jgi:hypothetical protein
MTKSFSYWTWWRERDQLPGIGLSPGVLAECGKKSPFSQNDLKK